MPPTPSLLTIDEYREIMNDYQTPDDVIQRRLLYIQSLCKNVISTELEKYLTQIKKPTNL